MNRRNSIKSILTLGFLGVSSFSAYKWFNLHQKIDSNTLLSYKRLINELAETIIPETDSPGGKSANVAEYICNVVLHCCTTLEQNRFISGLQNVESYTEESYHKTFFSCNQKERQLILMHFEARDEYQTPILNKLNNKIFGKPFFNILKNLTVEGYCNSEPGATRGLAYDYVPGQYKACVILKPNQKSWATK